jgi:hypothetical protein
MRNAKSLSLVALLAATSCGGATQPKPQCKAQQEQYAAQYFPSGFDPMAPPMGCTADDVLQGEVLFLQYYRTDLDGIPKLAIEPASIADAKDNGEMHQVDVKAMPEYSIGSFTSAFPDDHDICTAPKLADSTIEVAAIPPDPKMMGDMGSPAVSLRYHWSNVKMVDTPLSNAIYFGADLERTTGTCTLKYKVAATWPVVQCGDGTAPVLDDKGNPIPGMTMPDPSMGKPVPDTCLPSKVGADHGSGLSPQVDYECQASTLLCVPKNQFGPLKPL